MKIIMILPLLLFAGVIGSFQAVAQNGNEGSISKSSADGGHSQELDMESKSSMSKRPPANPVTHLQDRIRQAIEEKEKGANNNAASCGQDCNQAEDNPSSSTGKRFGAIPMSGFNKKFGVVSSVFNKRFGAIPVSGFNKKFGAIPMSGFNKKFGAIPMSGFNKKFGAIPMSGFNKKFGAIPMSGFNKKFGAIPMSGFNKKFGAIPMSGFNKKFGAIPMSGFNKKFGAIPMSGFNKKFGAIPMSGFNKKFGAIPMSGFNKKFGAIPMSGFNKKSHNSVSHANQHAVQHNKSHNPSDNSHSGDGHKRFGARPHGRVLKKFGAVPLFGVQKKDVNHLSTKNSRKR